MNIKKVIKFSFMLILVLVILIAAINTVVLFQIKDNELSIKNISSLVSLQENMNDIVIETINTKDEAKLKEIKNKFLEEENKFEYIKDSFILSEEDEFHDLIFSDIHKDPNIFKSLEKLFLNEKQIEHAFDRIFELQTEKIRLVAEFKSTYPKENLQRKKLEQEILKSNDLELIKVFSDLKYYSKETLYQHKNQVALDKWTSKIKLLIKQLDSNEFKNYLKTVEKIGLNIVTTKNIEIEEEKLSSEILNIINMNKKVNFDIETNIEKISSSFLSNVYIIVTILLLLTITFIILFAYKVYRNIGLSVDEIESKVQDGLVEIKTLNSEIEHTQKEVVFTMGAIGESRSKETGNHVKRVALYSKILALYYGLNEKEAEMLKQASPMHDIGKVAIPDSVLNKPGRFDEHERKIMDTHAALGYEMLKHSNRPLLKMAAIVAYEHHEKWDGSGYPRGLKGEDIHIYGRITALADVFDALGSDRVYKKAWDDERIFNLFKEERAKHFDPKLIDIFFEHLDEFLKIRDSLKDV